jgi:hypothetical protein
VPRLAIGGASSTSFAASFPSGDDVYVATLTTGDICLTDQEPPSVAGSTPSDTRGLTAAACSHPANAETTGIALLAPSINGSNAKITLLVPNGVTTVRFTDTTGASVNQPVTNNVAQFTAANLASATFLTPSGQTEAITEPPPPSP